MSALDHKRTLKHVRLMSALPPKADIGTQSCNVRFVPKADIQELGASVRGGSGNLLLRRQWKRWILPSQERRDAPHRDAAVCSFGTWGWNLQIMGAIALRCEILRRYAELLTQHHTDRFRSTVGDRWASQDRPDCFGVSFDQK